MPPGGYGWELYHSENGGAASFIYFIRGAFQRGNNFFEDRKGLVFAACGKTPFGKLFSQRPKCIFEKELTMGIIQWQKTPLAFC